MTLILDKYDALGNDYLVMPATGTPPSPELVQLICDRHHGVGSDGILYGPIDSHVADFGLIIYNPDGSVAEKSGNGLRIFSKFLIDSNLSKKSAFTIETADNEISRAQMDESNPSIISIDMGQVEFSQAIELYGQTVHPVTIGNPHAIILSDEPTEALAKELGPKIECDEAFPNRTNVQFLKVEADNRVKIEIWERGAGYTLASGSSATASAGLALKLGLVDKNKPIIVQMPGGELVVEFGENYKARLTGPVRRIGRIELDSNFLQY